eukprot:5270520-Prymnesium_polylepis.5
MEAPERARAPGAASASTPSFAPCERASVSSSLVASGPYPPNTYSPYSPAPLQRLSQLVYQSSNRESSISRSDLGSRNIDPGSVASDSSRKKC